MIMTKTSLNLLSLVFLAGEIQHAVPCSYRMNWGTASSLNWASDMAGGFDVAAGGTTTCTISSGNCAYSYLTISNDSGDSASGDAGDLRNPSTNCDQTVTISVSQDATQLDISIEFISIDDVILECSCSPPEKSGGTSSGPSPPRGGPGTGGCFSGDATVQVQNKGQLPMKKLKVGDWVLTKGNKYQPVYSFGHHQKGMKDKFFQIHTKKASKPLEMTGNHFVYVMDSADGSMKAVRADTIKQGDILVQQSQPVPVSKVTTAKKKGLFMPLTPSGTILVNDVLASSYVSIQEEAPTVVENSRFFPFTTEEMISHWWMSPYRMTCMGVSSTFCENEARNEDGILQWLLVGKSFAEYADEQRFIVRVFVLGVPMFLLFGFFNLVEVAFGGPSLAPLVFMALAGAFIWLLKKQKVVGNKKKAA